ncbi:glucan endo-1,3-beta-glucosidase [Morus notabilis]|uniref:glucan endo-1,3-beta-glucosidase n=1 Tax=Morus notabilis TaxID=981085 RepID=UPI000CED386A|nr:glucan endo-1,3-beta-glucosidase [Morus notabilis]
MASFSTTDHKTFMTSMFFLLGLLILSSEISGAQSIGVCYGKLANNLPTESEVINLYKSNNIGKMRIYSPDQATLQALKGSNIELIVDVTNEKLQSLTDAGAASDWVQRNIVSFSSGVSFKYIAVGNEIHPGDGEANFVLPAMKNVQSAINSASLQGKIKVSTSIDTSLLGKSYPPNDGAFSDAAKGYIKPIANFLTQNGSPLLANVYPYFAYTGDRSIDLQYALFNSKGSSNGTGYQNLFDAQLDALYAALEKVKAPDVKIVVSESGWPSEGDSAATTNNAGTYYRNLIAHVKGGTPKKPQGPIETYLFAMFNENQKDGAQEQHYGLFSPDKQPKYQLSFS